MLPRGAPLPRLPRVARARRTRASACGVAAGAGRASTSRPCCARRTRHARRPRVSAETRSTLGASGPSDCGALAPRARAAPLNTVVQAAWAIVLGRADRSRRRRVRRHGLGSAAAAARRRVDDRPVHQHRSRCGSRSTRPRPLGAAARSGPGASRRTCSTTTTSGWPRSSARRARRRLRHADRVRVLPGRPRRADRGDRHRRACGWRGVDGRDAAHYPLSAGRLRDDRCTLKLEVPRRTCSTTAASRRIAAPVALLDAVRRPTPGAPSGRSCDLLSDGRARRLLAPVRGRPGRSVRTLPEILADAAGRDPDARRARVPSGARGDLPRTRRAVEPAGARS